MYVVSWLRKSLGRAAEFAEGGCPGREYAETVLCRFSWFRRAAGRRWREVVEGVYRCYGAFEACGLAVLPRDLGGCLRAGSVYLCDCGRVLASAEPPAVCGGFMLVDRPVKSSCREIGGGRWLCPVELCRDASPELAHLYFEAGDCARAEAVLRCFRGPAVYGGYAYALAPGEAYALRAYVATVAEARARGRPAERCGAAVRSREGEMLVAAAGGRYVQVLYQPPVDLWIREAFVS